MSELQHNESVENQLKNQRESKSSSKQTSSIPGLGSIVKVSRSLLEVSSVQEASKDEESGGELFLNKMNFLDEQKQQQEINGIVKAMKEAVGSDATESDSPGLEESDSKDASSVTPRCLTGKGSSPQWDLQDDRKLLELQQEYGNKWAYISRHLPNRNEQQIKIRFKSIMRAMRRMWSKEDDEKLLKIRKETKADWNLIAARFPKRTKNAVRVRYQQLLNKQIGFLDIPVPGSPRQALLDSDSGTFTPSFIRLKSCEKPKLVKTIDSDSIDSHSQKRDRDESDDESGDDISNSDKLHDSITKRKKIEQPVKVNMVVNDSQSPASQGSIKSTIITTKNDSEPCITPPTNFITTSSEPKSGTSPLNANIYPNSIPKNSILHQYLFTNPPKITNPNFPQSNFFPQFPNNNSFSQSSIPMMVFAPIQGTPMVVQLMPMSMMGALPQPYLFPQNQNSNVPTSNFETKTL